VGAARAFAERTSRAWLAAGFGVCALAAAGALLAQTMPGFAVVALLTGLGTGFTTVTLAGVLRPATGDRRLGLIIGLGTGLAYGLGNVPGIFDARPALQAGLAILAAFAGGGAAIMLRPRFAGGAPEAGDYSKAGIAAWVVLFLALVCFDSALFTFIQGNAELKQSLWLQGGRPWMIAGLHLVTAVAAGWLLDFNWLGRTVACAAGALAGAGFWLIDRRAGGSVASLVYVTSVSIYSTALVFYPARSARPGLAALLYAVAGWVGSALGIACAESRTDLPVMLLPNITGLLALGLAGRYFASRRRGAMNENSGA
jgi:cytochrome c oxidase cbb3-type subunit 2